MKPIKFSDLNKFSTHIRNENNEARNPEQELILDLSFHGIRDEGVRTLAEVIKDAKQHVTVDLGINIIGPDSATALAKAIKGALYLVTLVLNDNEIGNAGAIAFAKMIKGVKQHVTLNLCRNHIGPEGAIALAEAIREAPHSVTLNLAMNPIDPGGTSAFHAVIDKLIENNKLPIGTEIRGVEGILEKIDTYYERQNEISRQATRELLKQYLPEEIGDFVAGVQRSLPGWNEFPGFFGRVNDGVEESVAKTEIAEWTKKLAPKGSSEEAIPSSATELNTLIP